MTIFKALSKKQCIINDNGQLKFTNCSYSNKLLDKLKLLNKNGKQIHINKIEKAIFYAKKYHGKQRRQSGEPFYSHPLEVAYMVSEYLFETDIIIAAILHDTIEDTDLTKKIIARVFGDQVADYVEDLTRIKGGKKINSAEMLGLLYKQAKYNVLLVKLFDRLHNMQTIFVKSPENIKKITRETLIHFLPFAQYFEIQKLEISLTELCIRAGSFYIKQQNSFNTNYRVDISLLASQDGGIPTNIRKLL